MPNRPKQTPPKQVAPKTEAPIPPEKTPGGEQPIEPEKPPSAPATVLTPGPGTGRLGGVDLPTKKRGSL